MYVHAPLALTAAFLWKVKYLLTSCIICVRTRAPRINGSLSVEGKVPAHICVHTYIYIDTKLCKYTYSYVRTRTPRTLTVGVAVRVAFAAVVRTSVSTSCSELILTLIPVGTLCTTDHRHKHEPQS